MPDHIPPTVSYGSGQLERVRATCLYVASKLGDLLNDIVVIGGLVPSLIIDQSALPDETERHLGTQDLDLGLSVGLLEEERYLTVSQRLREAGFSPDINAQGNPTRQRLQIQ